MNLDNIINMVKELDSYLESISNKYPHIPKKELQKILEYGFNIYFLLTKKGADIQIRNSKYDAYCGKLFIDDLKRVLYNNIKSRIKLRLKYKYAQEIYDGNYYFGLNESEWEYYQSQIKNKRRNKVTFNNIKLYKIKEECFLDKSKKYFFILNYPIDVGWSFIKDQIKTRNYKYFAYRDDKNYVNII